MLLDFHDPHQDFNCEMLYKPQQLYIKLISMNTLVENPYLYYNYEEKYEDHLLPAIVARVSHKSNNKIYNEKTYNDAINNDSALAKKLIQWGHDTPLEFIQLVFYVEGISRSAVMQWDRQRIGVGFIQQSTRYCGIDNWKYVYNSYHEITSESVLNNLLTYDSYLHVENEKNMRNKIKILKKEIPKNVPKRDQKINEYIRKFMPSSASVELYVHYNLRSLREFFNLRLFNRHAEWEIRRLACKIWNIVIKTPLKVYFEDMYNKFVSHEDDYIYKN